MPSPRSSCPPPRLTHELAAFGRGRKQVGEFGVQSGVTRRLVLWEEEGGVGGSMRVVFAERAARGGRSRFVCPF